MDRVQFSEQVYMNLSAALSLCSHSVHIEVHEGDEGGKVVCVRVYACVCACVCTYAACRLVSPSSATECIDKAHQRAQWTRRRVLAQCRNPGSFGALEGEMCLPVDGILKVNTGHARTMR